MSSNRQSPLKHSTLSLTYLTILTSVLSSFSYVRHTDMCTYRATDWTMCPEEVCL
jgi:hypothetical protein